MKALTLKQNIRIMTNPKEWIGIEETEEGYKLYFSSNLRRLSYNLGSKGNRGYLFKRLEVANEIQENGSFDPAHLTAK